MTEVNRETGREFWRTHALWPGLVFAIALTLILSLDLDQLVARTFFFDASTGRWMGAASGSWWARDLIHTNGGRLVTAIGVTVLCAWIASFLAERLKPWRRRIGFVLAAIVLSIGIVDGLKTVTNVDCPWDLAGFGGDRPYVALFADRPDSLPRGRCFPGAHASSGFALVFGYFLLRDRWKERAAWALIGAIAVGVIFSLGQESRGAHFISHDLSAAALVWFTQLLLYVAMVKPKEAASRRSGRAVAEVHDTARPLSPRMSSTNSPP